MRKKRRRLPVDRVDELLYAILQGKVVAWPAFAETAFQARFLAACDMHGVLPLVYRQLSRTSAWPAWPVRLREALTQHSRAQVALAVLREQELIQVLRALAVHGVSPLLMKGAPLAYTHYAASHLRPRCDTDLFIRQQDIAITQRVLTDLGYIRRNAVSGKLIMHQCTYVKEDRYGARHACDVHWKISNPYPFSELLSYNELARQAITIPALGKQARALAPVQALLLACVHRVAHHHNSERLIWLYDIHLLASGMTCDELARFARLAVDRRLRDVCRSNLQLVQQRFATSLPTDFMQMLYGSQRLPTEEATARFLKPNPRRLHILLGDIRTLSGWRNKMRLLKEHLFPSPVYLLERYATANRAWLPLLYVWRAVQGAWKLRRRAAPL